MGHGGEKGSRSYGGAAGTTGRGGIQRLEAGTEVTESSEEEGRRGGRSAFLSIKS